MEDAARTVLPTDKFDALGSTTAAKRNARSKLQEEDDDVEEQLQWRRGIPPANYIVCARIAFLQVAPVHHLANRESCKDEWPAIGSYTLMVPWRLFPKRVVRQGN